MEVLYFGCIKEAGHYLHNTKGKRSLDFSVVPWPKIDGVLCPEYTIKEGASKLHHKDGWTALAFWDYSVDKRPGSNSVFFAEGIHGFEHMIQFGKDYFGQIMERFSFTIKREE